MTSNLWRDDEPKSLISHPSKESQGFFHDEEELEHTRDHLHNEEHPTFDSDACYDEEETLKPSPPVAFDRRFPRSKKQDDDGEDDEPEQALTEDAYSLLYTADLFSRTTAYAFAVVSIQNGLLALTLTGLLDLKKKTNGVENRMKIPAGADILVTLAQFLGLLLTVMVMATQGDIITGLIQLLDGYDADITYEFPNATKRRWFVTGILQFLSGLIMVVCTFVLAMQSTEIITLILNLTALHFIQEVDDLAFQVGTMGLLSRPVKKDCDRIKEVHQVPMKGFTRDRLRWQQTLLVLLSIGLFVPYGCVVYWQLSGTFSCETIHLQLGDTQIPDAALHSGRFVRQWKDNSRDFYENEQQNARIGYCKEEKAWTISRVTSMTVSDLNMTFDVLNPCLNIMFKSATTSTFDVMEVADEPWLAKIDGTGFSAYYEAAEHVKVTCAPKKCSKETCKGECLDDRCVCANSTMVNGVAVAAAVGDNCEFRSSCPFYHLMLGEENHAESFLFQAAPSSIDPRHGRPIYVSYNESSMGSINAVMFFSGLRWTIYLATAAGLKGPVTDTDLNDLGLFSPFPKNGTNGFKFHAYSIPLDYGKKQFAKEPHQLEWFFPDPDKVVDVVIENCPNGENDWWKCYYGETTKKSFMEVDFAGGKDAGKDATFNLSCAYCNDYYVDAANLCQNGGYCKGANCHCSNNTKGRQCVLSKTENGETTTTSTTNVTLPTITTTAATTATNGTSNIPANITSLTANNVTMPTAPMTTTATNGTNIISSTSSASPTANNTTTAATATNLTRN